MRIFPSCRSKMNEELSNYMLTDVWKEQLCRSFLYMLLSRNIKDWLQLVAHNLDSQLQIHLNTSTRRLCVSKRNRGSFYNDVAINIFYGWSGLRSDSAMASRNAMETANICKGCILRLQVRISVSFGKAICYLRISKALGGFFVVRDLKRSAITLCEHVWLLSIVIIRNTKAWSVTT